MTGVENFEVGVKAVKKTVKTCNLLKKPVDEKPKAKAGNKGANVKAKVVAKDAKTKITGKQVLKAVNTIY